MARRLDPVRSDPALRHVDQNRVACRAIDVDRHRLNFAPRHSGLDPVTQDALHTHRVGVRVERLRHEFRSAAVGVLFHAEYEVAASRVRERGNVRLQIVLRFVIPGRR